MYQVVVVPEHTEKHTTNDSSGFPGLSQENPNYSFLLPFAQYNLQCPGYYLPVLRGKWVYPHSNSTCRIWNKIISYSAITRDPHRGGWVVGRASGGISLALWQKEMYLLPSLLLVGDFCRNRLFSLNIRPSVTYRQRPFCKIPYIRFFLVYQSLCLTFFVGVACSGNERNFSSLGGACYAHKTNGDFLG